MFLYFSFNEKSNKNIIELSSSGNSLQVLTSIKACASGYPVLLPDTESFLYNSSLQSQANITSQKPRPSWIELINFSLDIYLPLNTPSISQAASFTLLIFL